MPGELVEKPAMISRVGQPPVVRLAMHLNQGLADAAQRLNGAAPIVDEAPGAPRFQKDAAQEQLIPARQFKPVEHRTGAAVAGNIETGGDFAWLAPA